MMSKELNDLLIRDNEIATLELYYRQASTPDKALTYDRREVILLSLKEERSQIWKDITRLCDALISVET